MTRYLAGKVARALGIVVLVTVLTQLMLDLTPGSVSAIILGDQATQESTDQLDAKLGLDQPFFTRYLGWLGNALQGDLGTSPLNGQSVADAIKASIPVTVELVILSILLALILAFVTGIASARRPGGVIDTVMGVTTSAALSFPAFLVAPVLAYIFAVQLGWVPVLGYVPLSESVSGNLKSLALPVIAIALPEFAVLQRLLRADLATTLDDEYIDAARGRGIREGRIIARHALRPSVISLMTVTGITIGRLIGGTVVVEVFFSLPGIGSLLVRAIFSRDLIMVQGCVVVIALAYVFINLAVDLTYGVVDPRIRIRADA